MTVEYAISRPINAKIHSADMFPPQGVSRESSPNGLEDYEFNKATGRNILSVLKEDFLKKNTSFTNQELVNEVNRLLKLSTEESESLFAKEERQSTRNSSGTINKYLSIKFLAAIIKPSYVAEVFRRKAKDYADKSRLEMIAAGEGDYLLGSYFWMWTGSS